MEPFDDLPYTEQEPPGRLFIDWGKTIQIAIIITATVVLGIVDVISKDTAQAVIFSAIGYIFGNGKNIRDGHDPAPLIGRRKP